jgi:transposase-like protein
MIKCAYCNKREGQVKAGLNRSGSQRYRCGQCQRRYTPEPAQHGYSEEIRQRAIENSVDGMNYRRIGRRLGVDHHTVMNWVKAHTDKLADSPPLPSTAPDVSELDELYSFIGDKKIGAMS